MSEPYNPPTAPPPSGPPMHGGPGLPWDRERSGNSLVDTAKRLITAPGTAFAEMREKGDYLSPILFAVIFGTFGAVIGQIWNLVFGASMIGFLPPEMQQQLGQAFAPSLGGVLINIVLSPFLVAIFLFIGSGIYHLFLLLLGGTKESTAGYEGSLRSVSYSGVANLAYIVPFVGTPIAIVWGIVLNVIGLSRVHHTSTGKALGAVLLPLLLCCICAIAIAVSMGAAIGAAMSGAGQ